MGGIVWRGKTKIFCGGGVISDRWILSAAHCFIKNNREIRPNEIEALLGEHDYATKDSKTIRMAIAQIIQHPDYQKLGRNEPNNDFSLLKMKKTIDFSKYGYIRPICLPIDNSQDYVGATATITGWGHTCKVWQLCDPSNVLRKVNVKIMGNDRCQDKYNQDYQDEKYQITDQMMCTYTDNIDYEDSCKMDSGGPVITRQDNVTYEVIGLVSWGESPCGGPEYPGVKARVTTVLKWIRSTTRRGWNTCLRA